MCNKEIQTTNKKTINNKNKVLYLHALKKYQGLI